MTCLIGPAVGSILVRSVVFFPSNPVQSSPVHSFVHSFIGCRQSVCVFVMMMSTEANIVDDDDDKNETNGNERRNR